jgi:hypothetical protein
LGRDNNGLIGSGSRAEGVRDHERLAKAARHEEVADVLDEPAGPDTQERDAHQIEGDNSQIKRV